MTDTLSGLSRQETPCKTRTSRLRDEVAAKIRVTDTIPFGLPTPCWAWLGAHDARGYARVRVGERVEYVRRIVLKCEGVPLDKGRQAISLCREPGCVNPQHMLVGSKEIARAFGKHGHIAVTDFSFARMAITMGDVTPRSFARMLGVPTQLVEQGIARCAGAIDWPTKRPPKPEPIPA